MKMLPVHVPWGDRAKTAESTARIPGVPGQHQAHIRTQAADPVEFARIVLDALVVEQRLHVASPRANMPMVKPSFGAAL